MKKILILLLFATLLLGLGSCTKLENCDCGIEGKFVYFEDGMKCYVSGHSKKVNAIVYTSYKAYPIDDYIPREFRVQDTLNVSVCVKEIQLKEVIEMPYVGPDVFESIYKLTCIERR